ncbi:MAG: NAD(+)/NADH kinase [Deltaproteobacteria bacterium]|nr:NAD(+)/NADH kinase [Deltaproteobacteria bacterium]
MAKPEVLVVYKKSQLRLALEKRNSRIKRLLRRGDPSTEPMRAAHEAHEATLVEVERALGDAGVGCTRVYRARLRAGMCEGRRLVISVGGDGTLLDTSHKVAATPVLGVNSDTAHSVGFLCAAHRGTFAALLSEVLAGRLKPTAVRRLGGTIDGAALPFPVLNDVLVAHKNPAATSRVLVEHRGVVEDQKSSGIWVATAAGSTAAMSSAGGEITGLHDARAQLRVREPFLADGPRYALATLWLSDGDEVSVTSKMREGRVYLDGPHEVLDLPMGARLTLSLRAPPLLLFATQEMALRRETARQNALRSHL